MAASNADITATTAWQDLVATYAGLASASAYVQNKGPAPAIVQFSASATPPSAGSISGLLVGVGDVAYGTAAHIWVRALRQTATIQSGLTD